jgi:hypothetical protein
MRKNIKDEFNEFSKQYSNSLIAFAQAIRGNRFNKVTIQKTFDSLVDPDDYAKNERNLILKQMYNITTWKSRIITPEIERDMRLGNGMEKAILE